ncbi:acyl-CoA N-acyltransferase [Mycena floridula]|nr:acyl-CoA N-acyltransferase [Mycena floridula]
MVHLEEPKPCDIRVRLYQPNDFKRVRHIFLTGMVYGPRSPAYISLPILYKQKSSYAAYGIAFCGLLFSRHIVGWMIMLVAAAYLVSIIRQIDTCGSKRREQRIGSILSSAFWVAEALTPGESPQVVGTVALDGFSKDDPKRGELLRMSALPSHRGRGVASILLRTLLSHAREHNLTSIFLITSPIQPDALRLYAKFGWTFRQVVHHFPMGHGFAVPLKEYELVL